MATEGYRGDGAEITHDPHPRPNLHRHRLRLHRPVLFLRSGGRQGVGEGESV